jgi:hypothetical protein
MRTQRENIAHSGAKCSIVQRRFPVNFFRKYICKKKKKQNSDSAFNSTKEHYTCMGMKVTGIVWTTFRFRESFFLNIHTVVDVFVSIEILRTFRIICISYNLKHVKHRILHYVIPNAVYIDLALCRL